MKTEITTHAKAPWLVETDGLGDVIIVSECRNVCLVEGYYKDAEANARLIAAAPLMLSVLRAVALLVRVNADTLTNQNMIYKEILNAIEQATITP